MILLLDFTKTRTTPHVLECSSYYYSVSHCELQEARVQSMRIRSIASTFDTAACASATPELIPTDVLIAFVALRLRQFGAIKSCVVVGVLLLAEVNVLDEQSSEERHEADDQGGKPQMPDRFPTLSAASTFEMSIGSGESREATHS